MIKSKKTPTIYYEDIHDALTYIEEYWSTITQTSATDSSTSIKLPHPFIIPSPGNNGFAFQEQYYWDSYFTAIGIDDEELVSGMLENLIYLFKKFGLIPNASRYYFTSRSQPPILTTYIFHVYEKYHKSLEWLQDHIAVAKQEYTEVWMSSEHPHARNVYSGLSRYYDINSLHDLAEAESGWDMTPRFKRQCLDYLPIDLNCLLFKYEADFARAAELTGDTQEAKKWIAAKETRRDAVTTLMWSKMHGFFFDYNYQTKKKGSVWSVAAYYALWSGLATREQAARLVKNLPKFTKKGGLTTTTGTFLNPQLFGSTKTQWAYPNGWAPLHFIVIEGLASYGYSGDEHNIVHLWLKTCNDWFTTHGEFIEKYNVVNPKKHPLEGVYPSQTGFGWTNGVFAALAKKYAKTAE